MFALSCMHLFNKGLYANLCLTQGLNSDCLRTIRNCKKIERLVYVSCNPTGSLPKDATLLCGPVSKRLHGAPFRPVSATPVDLFPMTPHCEMVVVFDRISPADSAPTTAAQPQSAEAVP